MPLLYGIMGWLRCIDKPLIGKQKYIDLLIILLMVFLLNEQKQFVDGLDFVGYFWPNSILGGYCFPVILAVAV